MRGHPCWECGKPSPGGVCEWPHPRFQMTAAVRAQMVMNFDKRPPAEVLAGSDRRRGYRREYYQENRERIVAQFRLAQQVRDELRWNRELRELAAAR